MRGLRTNVLQDGNLGPPSFRLRILHSSILTFVISVYEHLASPTCLANTLSASVPSPLVIGFLGLTQAAHFLRYREMIKLKERDREKSWTPM